MKITLVVNETYVAGVAPATGEKFFGGPWVLVITLDGEGGANADFAFRADRYFAAVVIGDAQ